MIAAFSSTAALGPTAPGVEVRGKWCHTALVTLCTSGELSFWRCSALAGPSGCRITTQESRIEAISSLSFEGMLMDALGSLGSRRKLRASKKAGVVSRGSENVCLL